MCVTNNNFAVISLTETSHCVKNSSQIVSTAGSHIVSFHVRHPYSQASECLSLTSWEHYSAFCIHFCTHFTIDSLTHFYRHISYAQCYAHLASHHCPNVTSHCCAHPASHHCPHVPSHGHAHPASHRAVYPPTSAYTSSFTLLYTSDFTLHAISIHSCMHDLVHICT